MKLLWQLSVRNLFRHRRRTLMLVAAIVVAVSSVTLLNSLIRGFQYDLAESAVANLTGHIKILAPGYRDDPSIEKSFEIAKDWQPDIPAQDMQGWAPRVRVPAVIMSERETRGIQLVGVDPASEHISFVGSARYIGERLVGSDDKRVVIGKVLAEQLETDVGRRLVLITQGADGLNREAGFRVAGLYDAEGTSLEKAFVFTGLSRLQAMLDAEVVTEVSVRLNQELHMSGIKTTLVDFFSGLDVLDWRELEPQAAAMFVFADTAIYIWFLIMMGALVFGLVNTLITSVMERVREFGMLRAVGMRAKSIVAQVVIESSIVMAVSVAIGLALGGVFIYWLRDGIDLTQWAEGMEMAGMRSVMYPHPQADDFVLVAFLSMLLGVFASLYPAWRATKIKPLEALRR
ncbi:MAG: FtsX-like permease family protein [Pseudomonadales bacterium]|nr:FtsX-like permease family protein [Pseudomonadales bacterium]MDP6471920.1 FtsX-like permease family protein [Pseudomonadales bacterium]MDP6826810.1 FtsX-like permease family protein [Pseudomonadales bacterium]MDP6970912.1 FtsX-like permease family protein [Pseudomonadales bacterium]